MDQSRPLVVDNGTGVSCLLEPGLQWCLKPLLSNSIYQLQSQAFSPPQRNYNCKDEVLITLQFVKCGWAGSNFPEYGQSIPTPWSPRTDVAQSSPQSSVAQSSGRKNVSAPPQSPI